MAVSLYTVNETYLLRRRRRFNLICLLIKLQIVVCDRRFIAAYTYLDIIIQENNDIAPDSSLTKYLYRIK